MDSETSSEAVEQYNNTLNLEHFFQSSTPPFCNNGTCNEIDVNNNTVIDVSESWHYAAFTLIIVTVLASFLAVLTIIGNILVVVAFRLDKLLQTVSNYFLLSLAIADLTIGAVSMPLYTIYLLMGYWPFGSVLCDTWLSLDYTMSNASVANLIIISFDRYFSVTRPLTYRIQRTPRRAGIMICIAWIISVMLWTPWIFAWPHLEGGRNVPKNECYIQFLKTNRYMSIFTAIAAFYIPVAIMFVVYCRIYQKTRKRQKLICSLQGVNKFTKARKNERLDSISGQYSDAYRESDSLQNCHSRMHNSASDERKALSCSNINEDYHCNDVSDASEYSALQCRSSSYDAACSSSYEKSKTIKQMHTNTKCLHSTLNATMFNSSQSVEDSESIVNFPFKCKDIIGTLPLLDTSILQPTWDLSASLSHTSNLTATTPLCESSTMFSKEREDLDQGLRIIAQLTINKNGTENRDVYTQEKNSPIIVQHRPIKMSTTFNSIAQIDDNQLKHNYFIRPKHFFQRNHNQCEKTSKSVEYRESVSDNNDSSEEQLNLLSVKNLDIIGSNHPRRDRVIAHADDCSKIPCASVGGRFSQVSCINPQNHRRFPYSDHFKHESNSAHNSEFTEKTVPNTSTPPWLQSQQIKKRHVLKRHEGKQDQKAAKTLTAILLAFLVTWTPYSIFTLVETFCAGCINETLYSIGE